MKKEHPLADLLRRVRPQPQPPFVVAETISLPVGPNECREAKADRSRQWCHANCKGRWRPMGRGNNGAVRIEFEDPTDAIWFWLSN